MKPARRVVAIDREPGRSSLVSDAPSPDVRIDPARPGFAMQRMWVADRAPARLVFETLHLPYTLEPPAGGKLWSAACEGAGFVDQLGPSGRVAVADQDPFAEGSASRGERLARACPDELLNAVLGEFDDEVAGAVVAGGKERARDTQAGKAHHRSGSHVAVRQRGRADLPEEIGGLPSHACLLP